VDSDDEFALNKKIVENISRQCLKDVLYSFIEIEQDPGSFTTHIGSNV